jgi:hypothetical protein
MSHQGPWKTRNLFFLQNFCKRFIYPLRIEIETQLANDETAAGFKKLPICTEEFEKVHHENLEVALF